MSYLLKIFTKHIFVWYIPTRQHTVGVVWLPRCAWFTLPFDSCEISGSRAVQGAEVLALGVGPRRTGVRPQSRAGVRGRGRGGVGAHHGGEEAQFFAGASVWESSEKFNDLLRRGASDGRRQESTDGGEAPFDCGGVSAEYFIPPCGGPFSAST